MNRYSGDVSMFEQLDADDISNLDLLQALAILLVGKEENLNQIKKSIESDLIKLDEGDETRKNLITILEMLKTIIVIKRYR